MEVVVGRLDCRVTSRYRLAINLHRLPCAVEIGVLSLTQPVTSIPVVVERSGERNGNFDSSSRVTALFQLVLL